MRALVSTLEHESSEQALVAAIWSGWGLPAGRGFVSFSPEWQELSRSERAEIEAEQRRVAQARVSDEYRRAVDEGPWLRWPGREMVLFATTFDELNAPEWPENAGIDENPLAMLWPADHAWVLASEIDWDFTIIAGPPHLIDQIIADSRWEAVAVSADDDLSWAGDVVNQ